MFGVIEPHEAITVQAVECEEAVGGGVDVEPPVAGAAYAERSGHERFQHSAVGHERDVAAAVLLDDAVELGERAVAHLVKGLPALYLELLRLIQPGLPFLRLLDGELGLLSVLPRSDIRPILQADV